MPPEAGPKDKPRLGRGRCPGCRLRLNPWGVCRRRACPLYRSIYARDQRECLRANLGSIVGDVRVTNVTPPGSARWRCSTRTPHACPGRACAPSTADIIGFNRAASKNFTRLHRAAVNRIERSGKKLFLHARVWELQRRGLLHVHLVLGYGTEEERTAADAYCRALAELASKYDFGFVERKRRVFGAAEVAGYLGKRIVETAVTAPNGMSIVYVSPKLTTRTGVTMRALRLRRRDYARRLRRDGGTP